MPNLDLNEGTGRFLIFFLPGNLDEVRKTVAKVAGVALPPSMEAAMRISAEGVPYADKMVAPTLGVAVCTADPDQVMRLQSDDSPLIRFIRPEYVFRIAGNGESVSDDYLRGFEDGVSSLAARLRNGGTKVAGFETLDGQSLRDTDDFTWGLQAVGLPGTLLTGANVRIAVLDTGYDSSHPDFSGLDVQSKSFVENIATAQDDQGHGTHCLGTVAGPKKPAQGPRYGLAPEAKLFVGKTMDNEGYGKEFDILQGIEWALQNECRIVSLSLGKPVDIGAAPEGQYEQVGKVALSRNCLIVAAAGNGSSRPGLIRPVDMPANSTKILAVGAVDRRFNLYPKSNGGLNPNGGNIDLVAPGVDVYSSKPGGIRGLASGTSMSAPHVSGLAALFMQSDPAASAEEIWTRLVQNARNLPLPGTDVGSGLAYLPS
jgi:subtilisin